MIKKLKFKEKYKFYNFEYSEETFEAFSEEYQKVFVNDEGFLHNDVGPADSWNSGKNDWHWNGIFIE